MKQSTIWKHALALSVIALAAIASGAIAPGASAQQSAEEELHVHRLQSTHTAPYDAWAHANRVAPGPSEHETVVEFAGNVIFSRLSNIEGRIQLKVMEGFDRAAYLGYKTFLRAWPDDPGVGVGNCVACHTPPSFGDKSKAAPGLRNLHKTDKELQAVIKRKIAAGEKARKGQGSEAYKLLTLGDEDVTNLVAFLQSLNEVPKEEFRELILNAEILDTSDIMK